MLTAHGWKSNPSPRRGFTVVEASRGVTESPVVLAVHDSIRALHFFRTALDEAMSRCRDLMVLDYATPSLHDELVSDSLDVGERDRSAMKALWTNPHVRVIEKEPEASRLQGAVTYCETVNASLLMMGADHFDSSEVDPDLANRLFHGQFDLLLLS